MKLENRGKRILKIEVSAMNKAWIVLPLYFIYERFEPRFSFKLLLYKKHVP